MLFAPANATPTATNMIAKTLARQIAAPLAGNLVVTVGSPYPLDGRVLDLDSFSYTSITASDLSGEGNNATLYSGRGASSDGVGTMLHCPT